MSGQGYALLGLTGLVAALVAALTFAVFRFMVAARTARGQIGARAESALLSHALQDAVSTLKAQEQAMSARAVASEQLSEQVFDSLTAGLLVIESDGRVISVNPAARTMLGIESAPAGITYTELLVDAAPLADVMAEGLTAGRPVVRRSVRVQTGARACHLGVTVSPFGSPGGRRGAICLFSDLTALVELEEQLRTKAALATLGEMTAGLAHEFRNGLATIHGYSRLMDPDRVPAEYRACVEGIRQETDMLGRVVTNFLSFARPESLALAPVDLKTLIERTAEDLRMELPASATVTVTGTFGTVPGDDILLRQTFANLIRNAVEASQEADAVPVVTIEGKVDPAERVSFVSVDDNGPGVPEPDRARIFQPFFTTRSRGSGLGLSIVQKIVLLHNGRVTVGAAPCGGARIELTLPLAA